MYLAKLTSNGFKEALQQIDTIVLPVGSIEAHGPHCPISTDILIPERMAAELEGVLGDRLLIAPTIPYGYSPDLAYFPGTVHVSGETLAAYICDVASSWLKWGIKHVVLLNGHGGNIPALTLATDKLVSKGARVMTVSWWLHFSSTILEICESQGHAGEDETSLVLAIDASLVEMEKATAYEKRSKGYFKVPDMVTYTFPEAMNGDARKATFAKGEAMYYDFALHLRDLIEELWQDKIVS
ncbi:MAG: creatininase family protein [Symbiobacteriaceae bacterium]|nr:creatininase family protein [Symbiobacteriaceae bacterium]